MIELAVIGASIIPSVVAGAKITHRYTRRTGTVMFSQAMVGAAIGVAAVELLALPTWVIIGTLSASQTPHALNAIINVWNEYHVRRALDGGYGDGPQWAAEIIRDDLDIEFAVAAKSLPRKENKEIAIISDSKEELRRLTVERFNELSVDQIPEDFAE
jgi:hypothetical protein